MRNLSFVSYAISPVTENVIVHRLMLQLSVLPL
jgi:hypothetical protein